MDIEYDGTLRCEYKKCPEKASKGDWPKGWVQIGASRFGTEFDPDGIASWCPKHRKRYKEKAQEG